MSDWVMPPAAIAAPSVLEVLILPVIAQTFMAWRWACLTSPGSPGAIRVKNIYQIYRLKYWLVKQRLRPLAGLRGAARLAGDPEQ
jgi:hypothetical protein